MKFYEKIIGINKDAPTAELRMTFSNNGFEFDSDLYLNDGKILSLKGEDTIYFRNSDTAISDSDYNVLRFNGNGGGISFDFESGTISGHPDGNLGSVTYPFNNIYATNGYFNKLIPSGENNAIGEISNRGEDIYTNRISATSIGASSINVVNLTIAPHESNPLVLPKSSKINFSSGSMRLGGADIRRIDIETPHIKRSTNSGNTGSDTDHQVKGRCVETRVGGLGCLQYFTKIDIAAITSNHYYLLIPSPVTDNLQADNDYLQLSYGATIINELGPVIDPFQYEGDQYFLIKRSDNLTFLYIQLTRFIFNV